MDSELADDIDVYGNTLKVEVSVSTGGVSGVTFTTVVELKDYRDSQSSVAKLREISTLLRRALPFQELKSEEQDFKRTDAMALDPHGNPLTKETAVKLGQEALRAALGEAAGAGTVEKK